MTMETYDKGDFFGIVRQENRSENVSAESDNKSGNEKSLPTDVEDFHGTCVTQIVGTEDIVPNRSTIVHEAVDPMDLDKEQENGIGHDVNETYGFTFRDSDSLPKKSNFETILHEAEPEDTYLDAQHHHRMQAPLSTHVLLSIREHESAVEQLAERIEARRANRTIVTQNTKFQFIERCKTISNVKYGTPSTKNMIRIEDLRTMHAQILSEIKNDERVNETWRGSLEFLGFHDQKKDLLMLVTRSIECTLRVNDEGDENWFPFFDFAFYDVRTVSRWPFLRNPPSIALFVVFIYYTLTPVLFCIIMDDEGVCPRDPTEKNREYYGTLSALYYASTTMSTVGYGDLSVQKGEDWRLLVAIIYMIISVLVAALAFSVAAETATTPFWGRYEKVIFDRLLGTPDNDEFLYQRTRRLIATTCSTIFIQVGSFVVLGVLIQRWFASDETKESQNWSWMTSYYWVVQTVTTIGYGDLDMSFDLVRSLSVSWGDEIHSEVH